MTNAFNDVTVDTAGDHVTITYSLTEPLEVPRVLLLATTVSAHDGHTSRQLGTKWVDDERVVAYVFDHTRGRQTNLEADVNVDGAVVTTKFPRSAVDDLGDDWSWRATIHIDGHDVAHWPPD